MKKINYRVLALVIAAICMFLTVAIMWALTAWYIQLDATVGFLSGMMIGFVAFGAIDAMCQLIRNKHSAWFDRGW